MSSEAKLLKDKCVFISYGNHRYVRIQIWVVTVAIRTNTLNYN